MLPAPSDACTTASVVGFSDALPLQRTPICCLLASPPPAAGSHTDPAVLDTATHGHGRWCVEVMNGLGLLGGGSAAAGGDGGRGASVAPLHVGISLGGAVLLDLVRPPGRPGHAATEAGWYCARCVEACRRLAAPSPIPSANAAALGPLTQAVVRPDAIGGAALLVPGALHPGKLCWRAANIATARPLRPVLEGCSLEASGPACQQTAPKSRLAHQHSPCPPPSTHPTITPPRHLHPHPVTPTPTPPRQNLAGT